MNQRERQQAQLPYKCSMDGLMEEMVACKWKVQKFNCCPSDDLQQQQTLIGELFGKVGHNPWVIQPFRCDYGSHIRVGDNFICNYNCVILDVGIVTIGNNVQFGPNVCISTAGHPIHPVSRRSGYEYGIPITIGDDVWLGCNVVVNPGVTIGKGAVIGAGSIVTKDIPEYTVAVGNPAKVIRNITEEDKKYYYKDRIFDLDDYE